MIIEVIEEVDESFDDFGILNNLGRVLYSREIVEPRLSPYLLTQYLRHNQSTLLIADQINDMKDSDVYLKYLYVYSMIKQFNLQSGRWVKSSRLKKEKDSEILKLSYHFNTSPEVTRKYMEVLTEDEVSSILSRYDGTKMDNNCRLVDVGAKSNRTVKKGESKKESKKIIL